MTGACTVSRRCVLGLSLAIALPRLALAASEPSDRAEWDAFKARFLQHDGRIVDSGNKGVSHTEGQGWGMYLAEWCEDHTAFKTIWDWTARTLRRPGDRLHSWRFDPSANPQVTDTNNATDGDLFMGAALSRAARRWNRPDYASAATDIAEDVLRLLVRRTGSRTVLLPAAKGFETATDVVINPSYYAFVAIQELATRVNSPIWLPLQRDGLALLTEGRFGRWGMQPDWMQISRNTQALAPATGWPPRFSFDAVRVPLYLAWSRLTSPALTAAYQAYWTQLPRAPGWVDLTTDASAPFAAPSGMMAVAMLITGGVAQDLPGGFPTVAQATDYYSAALTLLARIAWRESRG